ncbi:MAG TPA: hypothetical protein VN200_02660, partial [Rhodoglobus sp.]|nr:hypothetical protein [Rhodoglobus sp.]
PYRGGMRRLALLAPAILLLAGCATSAPPPPAAGGADPVDLVGLWRVSDAEGADERTWLRLDAGELTLWQECGYLSGAWVATDALFLGSIYGGNGDCISGNRVPELPWLEAAAGYTRTGDGWALTDAGGAVVATLSVDGAPAPHPDIIDDYTRPPVVTDATREALAPAAPLPSGFEVADVTGRWVATAPGAPEQPFVEFAPDGSWTGSDGCNGGAGRWASDGRGGLLTTSGVSTLIGCDGVQVPGMVASARSAGMQFGELVLFDAAGQELGRLQRG